jgi:spore photoproduct lyase
MFRIGTGEFMDSLALDSIVGWSDIICDTFSKRKNCILELKTKTDNIKKIISSTVRERIIVSWSLNSTYIASREEKGAPSIQKRLKAAKKCQEEGFIIGFHFDPLILHPEWKEGYKRTIDYLERYIDPKKVIWISMGCLRYIPSLKKIIRERHPYTEILNNEFIRGLDNKMRYFKPLRIEIYSFMRELIEAWAGSNHGLYLCMESDEIWRKSLLWSPLNSTGLSEYLDNRVRFFFN